MPDQFLVMRYRRTNGLCRLYRFEMSGETQDQRYDRDEHRLLVLGRGGDYVVFLDEPCREIGWHRFDTRLSTSSGSRLGSTGFTSTGGCASTAIA